MTGLTNIKDIQINSHMQKKQHHELIRTLGDDVIGFTRGFLYSGARSIVSSLWKVDDQATRDLMVGFYERLPRMKKDKALREAQLMV